MFAQRHTFVDCVDHRGQVVVRDVLLDELHLGLEVCDDHRTGASADTRVAQRQLALLLAADAEQRHTVQFEAAPLHDGQLVDHFQHALVLADELHTVADGHDGCHDEWVLQHERAQVQDREEARLAALALAVAHERAAQERLPCHVAPVEVEVEARAVEARQDAL